MLIIAAFVFGLSMSYSIFLLYRAQKHCNNAIKICEDAVKSLREKGV